MSVSVGVTVEIVDGNIISYNSEGSQMMCHRVRNIRHLAVTSSNRAGVFYIHKEIKKSQEAEVKLYKCYLFILESPAKVSYVLHYTCPDTLGQEPDLCRRRNI